MPYDCYCGDDYPTLYRSRIVKRARKVAKCEECGGPVLIGESYEYAFMIYDGEASTVKTCERCYDIRTWLRNNVPCLCIVHGNQDEANREAIDEAYYRAGNEVVGLRFGFHRRMILRRRRNNAARTGGAHG